MEKQIKLTLVRSLSGRKETHQATAHSLGLRKRHQSVLVKDTPCSRGMIKKIAYLLEIQEI